MFKFFDCYAPLSHFAELTKYHTSSKMSKKYRKSKAPIVVEESPTKLVVILDTTCLGLGKISWEGIYTLLEAEDPMEIEEEATTDGTDKTESMLNDLASSFLHK